MLLSSIIRAVRAYWRYRSSLFALSQLDERMLRDIGMSRGELEGRAWQAARQ